MVCRVVVVVLFMVVIFVDCGMMVWCVKSMLIVVVLVIVS